MVNKVLKFITTCNIAIFCYFFSTIGYSFEIDDQILDKGFIQIKSPERLRTKTTSTKTLNVFCKKVSNAFKTYGWKENPCSSIKWNYFMTTKDRHPIIYTRFGSGNNTTLILGGVHPDERTPIHLPFKIAQFLYKNKNQFYNKNNSVVIAPLINPDGFFSKTLLRTNKQTDPNRNFLTKDWYGSAFKGYIRTSKNLRKFPGYFPNLEPETIVQKELIERYNPKKIISIHAPLGFYDYDGPEEQNNSLYKKPHPSNHLVHSMAKLSGNHQVVNYSIFPGSLGKFSGYERQIPTVTLELQTTIAKKASQYWIQFKPAILKAINYNFLAKEASSKKIYKLTNKS